MKTIAKLLFAVLFMSTIAMAQKSDATTERIASACPCSQTGYYSLLPTVKIDAPLYISTGSMLFDITANPLIPGACYIWDIRSMPSNTPLVSSHSLPFPTVNHFQFYGFDVPAGTTYVSVKLTIKCNQGSVTLTKGIKVLPCNSTLDPTFHYTIHCTPPVPTGQFGLEFTYPLPYTSHFYVIQEFAAPYTTQYVVGAGGGLSTKYNMITPGPLSLVFGGSYKIKHYVINAGMICCTSYNIVLGGVTSGWCGSSGRMAKGELVAASNDLNLDDMPAEILKLIPANIKNAQTTTKVEGN